jgi:hypothetical protein
MRKRTIFRSSWLTVLALVALAALGTPADAQEQQDAPAVHVVIEGETLWDLAARYFGDPFLWPEIYRLNTTVVEDPHWIFPGEELLLGGPPAEQAPMEEEGVVMERPEAEVALGEEGMRGERPTEEVVVDEAPTPVAPPPPPTASGPTIFADDGVTVMGVTGTAARRDRAARVYEYYSSGFLTEDQALPFGSVQGAVDRPMLKRVKESSFAGMFDNILILPPSGGAYQPGDSLLLAGLLREVTGWGDIVYPTGIARVEEIGPDGVIAVVVAQFNRITDGQVSLPLEAFPDPGEVMPVPVDNGMMGAIIEPRQKNPVPGMQQVVFLDLGRDAGVKPGDMFTVLKASAEVGIAAKGIAYLRVVHTRDQSSTAMIVNLKGLGVEAGAPVQLVQKMPS